MGSKSTKKTAAKAKPRPKAKADKQRKASAAELSDAERRSLLFSHKRKIKPLLQAEKDAKAAVNKAYELAKKEGVTKKDIQLAILLETEEGVEKVKGQMQHILDIDRWMGKEVGTQLELFAKESSAEKAYDHGKRDALDDRPAKPPTHYSQTAANSYLEGHADGVSQLNEIRLKGFKAPATSLGDAATRVVESIGDQEPSHSQAAH